MYRSYYDSILAELSRTLTRISDEDTKELVENIINSGRIFITGKGRSGFIMKYFAIRLMQIGFEVHVLGDATTPAIKAGDMLIVGSGSGETGSLVVTTASAKKLGAKVALITMYGNSTIAGNADSVLVIPAKGSKFDKDADSDSRQPMCNLFEQSLLIFLDSLTMIIIDNQKIDKKLLYERHANLE
jgi:6-phospho-3-hexuloisomerase